MLPKWRMRTWLPGVFALLCLSLAAGCGWFDDDDNDNPPIVLPPDGGGTGGGTAATIPERFATSLHNTRAGKETWFNDDGGFGDFVTVSYSDLPCADCHDTRDQGPNDANPAEGVFLDRWPGEPNCQDCHAGEPAVGNVAMPETCLGCHGRQATEIARGFKDVHMDQLGFDCMSCHTEMDLHGDGTPYTTMFQPGAVDASCDDCHDQNELLGRNNFHNDLHLNAIDCSACHMTSALACYNCHFDNEGDETGSVTHAKFASAQFGGTGEQSWRFLVNRVIDSQGTTKIYPGSMQSLMADSVAANAPGEDNQGVVFVAIGPYYSHSIQKNAITCEDCHASANMQQYVDEGIIDVVRWRGEPGQEVPVRSDDPNQLTLPNAWIPPRGVIPIPPDYQEALRFDFVDLVDPAAPLTPTGTSASPRVAFMPDAQANIHLLEAWVRPLTAEQMTSLGWFNTSLHATRNGKETWYSDGIGEASPAPLQQGFGNFVDVPYDALPCADCHNGMDNGPWDADPAVGTFEDSWPGHPVCRDCHASESPSADATVPNDVCKGCHGRLAAEEMVGMADVHGGFECTRCHQLRDIHGVPGLEPATLFSEGALTADCLDCHTPSTAVLEHREHGSNLACSTCHMESVVTCYNCHFDNEASAAEDETIFHGKFASAQFGGAPESGRAWRLLVNRVLPDNTTQIYPGSMQTLVADRTSSEFPGEDDQGLSFVAIAPYYAHAITRNDALRCQDCHGTSAAVALAAGEPVQVIGWGAAEGVAVPPSELRITWQAPSGVIPVPPNPQELLRFDFVDLIDPALGPQSPRQFFESGPDQMHLPFEYVRPLTAEQLQSVAFIHNISQDCSACHPFD